MSDGDIVTGSTDISAPIFEHDSHPSGAVVISGPSERLTPDRQGRIDAMVARTARSLSCGAPL